MRAAIFALVLAGLLLQVPPVSAQPRCSDIRISATGAPGILHVTARRSATVAWSAKVKGELGATYASWGRATSRRLTCTRAERRFVCSASARPCRPITAGAACLDGCN
jgi:hypothetical protein